MMKPPAAFAGLEDMLDLGHGGGIDMRPTLLRVLTDLYLQRPTHTPEDERYYTELALRLIDATDTSQRAALAARLATYHRLLASAAAAGNDGGGRGLILEHSPGLTPADLSAIAERLAPPCRHHRQGPPVARLQNSRAETDSSAKPRRPELSELFYPAAAWSAV
jgi:hypothetical protein